ncbi:hypothetical protein DPX16_13519 [Anabarilius grahami]|uniref:Uncharacterized protein n=1 Tax=Anabarilius grahami TaxID=495550 RepID=A0A3N0YCT6_ANAGA|nr:hypothetical protein DPX16_13519 [Anabarilius grahami]
MGADQSAVRSTAPGLEISSVIWAIRACRVHSLAQRCVAEEHHSPIGCERPCGMTAGRDANLLRGLDCARALEPVPLCQGQEESTPSAFSPTPFHAHRCVMPVAIPSLKIQREEKTRKERKHTSHNTEDLSRNSSPLYPIPSLAHMHKFSRPLSVSVWLFAFCALSKHLTFLLTD